MPVARARKFRLTYDFCYGVLHKRLHGVGRSQALEPCAGHGELLRVSCTRIDFCSVAILAGRRETAVVCANPQATPIEGEKFRVNSKRAAVLERLL